MLCSLLGLLFFENPNISLDLRLRISILASSSSHSFTSSDSPLPLEVILDVILALLLALAPLGTGVIFGGENVYPLPLIFDTSVPAPVSGRGTRRGNDRCDGEGKSREALPPSSLTPAKRKGLSRGPALVCGLRGVGFLLIGEDDEEFGIIEADETLCEWSILEAEEGTGGGTSLWSLRERRGDFDFDRAAASGWALYSASLYFDRASWRSESFVETTKTSFSSSSMDSVPDGDDTMIW